MGFSLPGMVTPTLDVGELEKRIGDMRAVEGWLKMNLSMLQMAIQGLDMQRAAIAAVHAMSRPSDPAETQDGEASGNNPFMWPWNMMSAKTEETGIVPADSAAASDEKPRTKRKAANADK